MSERDGEAPMKISPEGHPHMDSENPNALMWVDESGILHVGDEELSWRLNADQARRWAKSLWAYAEAIEKVKTDE